MSDIHSLLKSNHKKLILKDMWKSFKQEIRKTLQLLRRMFSAGKVNLELKDTLSQLGLVIYQQHKSVEQNVEDYEIKNLINRVDYLAKLMDTHESEIRKIKNKPELS